jgi:hypothetical protein
MVLTLPFAHQDQALLGRILLPYCTCRAHLLPLLTCCVRHHCRTNRAVGLNWTAVTSNKQYNTRQTRQQLCTPFPTRVLQKKGKKIVGQLWSIALAPFPSYKNSLLFCFFPCYFTELGGNRYGLLKMSVPLNDSLLAVYIDLRPRKRYAELLLLLLYIPMLMMGMVQYCVQCTQYADARRTQGALSGAHCGWQANEVSRHRETQISPDLTSHIIYKPINYHLVFLILLLPTLPSS